jgi:fibronectin-binding autotransporter adhesin
MNITKNIYQTHIIQRSNIMKSSLGKTFVGRSLYALLTIALIATMAMGQGNLIITGGTFIGGGTGIYNVKGNITNTAPASITGIVNLNGTSPQAIGTTGAITFGTLKATAISTKTFGVNSTVATAIDLTTAGATQFNIGANQLTLQGTIANTGGAATPYVFSTSGAEVVYNGNTAVAQSIYGPITYDKLTLTGGAGATSFTLQGDVTAANTFSHTGATPLTIGHNLTVSGAASSVSFATIADVTGPSTLTLSGAGTKTIAAITTVTNGNTITNTGASLLTITALNGNAGIISGGPNGITFTNAATNGTGAITGLAGAVTFSSTLGNSGTITAGSGGIAFNGAVTRTLGSITSAAGLLNFNDDITGAGGTLSLTGTGSAEFAKAVSATGLSFATGTTVTYDGVTALQAIADVDYGNLTLKSSTKAWTLAAARTINNSLDVQGSSGTTVSGADLNVTGNISLASNLTMSDHAVMFASATSAVSGTNEIVGSVTRTHTFTAVPYTFNNAATIVTPTVVGGLTSFTINSLPATHPTGYLAGNSVDRKYTPSYVGGAGFTADVQLGYVASEYGGTSYSKLKFFQGVGGIVKANKIGGTYSSGTSGSFSYVKLPALASASLASATELGIDDRFNMFISKAIANWDAGTTWDMGSVPTLSDEVEIAPTFAVTIPNGVSAAALSVTIDVGASGGLTVGGGASGILAVGAGGLINNNILGTGLTVAAGGAVTITGGDLTNAGKITNDGTITVSQ